MKLLRKICSFVLCVALVFSVFSLDTNYVYAGTSTEIGGDFTSGGATPGWHVSFKMYYKISLHKELYDLVDEAMPQDGPVVLRSLIYTPKKFWSQQPYSTMLPFGDNPQGSVSELLNESTNCILIRDPYDTSKSNWSNIENSSVSINYNTELDGVNLSSVDLNYKTVTLEDFKNYPVFGNVSSVNELFSENSSETDTSGFNAFNNASTKNEALTALASIGDGVLTYDSTDCAKYIVVVERCVLARIATNAGSDSITPSQSGSSDGHEPGKDYFYSLFGWRNISAHNTANGKDKTNTNVWSLSLPGFTRTYKGTTNTISMGSTGQDYIKNSGEFIQKNYGPLVPWGKLYSGTNFSFNSICAGYAIWGYAGGEASPNDATNTLAIYDDIPIEGETANPDKWLVSSSILDGSLPELVDGDYSGVKYYDTTLHMWRTPDSDSKALGTAIDARNGSTILDDSSFMNGDKKSYGLVARDSFQTTTVFDGNLFDTVFITNGTTKSTSPSNPLDNAPNELVWGSQTVKDASKFDLSYGNIVSIETINSSDYKTEGLKAYAEQIGLNPSSIKRGELDSEKTIMTQIKDEIKSAMTLSGGDNYIGTGVNTSFHTSNTTLGSAIEVLVKAAPVTSTLHVITASGGVATYLPNVKDYEYTNVDWGTSHPKEDSGVKDVLAIGIALKDTTDGTSIASDLNGKVDVSDITSTFLINFPETGIEGDTPQINVGNEKNIGYDIYVLTSEEVTLPEPIAVELPDYLLNLYYNRIIYYTSDKECNYKLNWGRHTYANDKLMAMDLSSQGYGSAYNKKSCIFTTDSYKCNLGHCGVGSNPDHSTEHKQHSGCTDNFIWGDIVAKSGTSVKNYYNMIYKDISPVASGSSFNNKTMSYQMEADNSNSSDRYYLRPEGFGTVTFWSSAKPTLLRQNWGTVEENTKDRTEDLYLDYGFNFLRSAGGDIRTASGIAYASKDEAKADFLKLDFDIKYVQSNDVGTKRSSDASFNTTSEEIKYDSAFAVFNIAGSGHVPNDSGSDHAHISTWSDSGSKEQSRLGDSGILDCTRTCDHSDAEYSDPEYAEDGTLVKESEKTKDEVDSHSTEHNTKSVKCAVSYPYSGSTDVLQTGTGSNDSKTLAFVNAVNSTEVNDIDKVFDKRVYKYQTATMPTGVNSKNKGTNYTSSQVPSQGNVTDSSFYRLGYTFKNGKTLYFYPEVKMGYYENSSSDLSTGGSTYKGRVLTPIDNTYQNSGAAFNNSGVRTLYTMGEEKRSVESSSMYLYRIKKTSDDTVTGKTFSDSALSSSKNGSNSIINIPAGSDISVNAKPDGMEIDLYGYTLDVIRSDDTPSGKAYSEWVKSGKEVANTWGNTDYKSSFESDFSSWVNAMLDSKNYNADMILTEANSNSGSKVYNNFSAAVSAIDKYTPASGKYETGCYIIKVEHGVLDESFGGYKALIKQIKEDYGLKSDGEATNLFWDSGIPQSIIDSMETEKNALNKSYGNAKARGNAGLVLGVHAKHQGQLGNSEHWYDEMTRTFVVRRYASTGNKISNVVLQDKLDFGSSSNTEYGKNSNKRGNTGITGMAVWDLSIFISEDGLNAANPDKAICGLSGSQYLPRNNSGSTYKAISDGMKSFVDENKVILWNAPVKGAEFNIPSSTTSNFGD